MSDQRLSRDPTRRDHHHLSKWVLLASLALLIATPGRAAAGHALYVEPRILGRLPLRVEFELKAAFQTALERVRRIPACRSLFEDLGADGSAALTSTIYHLAPESLDKRVCQDRDAGAFTVVGSPVTWICPRSFLKVRGLEAALLLIHEALHQAGLPEWPPHAGALSSVEINQLVARSCSRSIDQGLVEP